MTSLYPRQEYLGGAAPSPLILSTTVGQNLVVSLLARRMRYLWFVQFGDGRLARNHIKLLGQVYYSSERKASHRLLGFRMCLINSALGNGRKTVPCVNDWTAQASSRRVSMAPRNSYDRKTIRDKVTSCTFTKIVINSTVRKNKEAQWRLSPRANSYNTRAFGAMT